MSSSELYGPFSLASSENINLLHHLPSQTSFCSSNFLFFSFRISSFCFFLADLTSSACTKESEKGNVEGIHTGFSLLTVAGVHWAVLQFVLAGFCAGILRVARMFFLALCCTSDQELFVLLEEVALFACSTGHHFYRFRLRGCRGHDHAAQDFSKFFPARSFTNFGNAAREVKLC